MKNTKNEMTTEFKKRYAELSAKAKDVKAKLKAVLKDAKELSKESKSLYDFANDRIWYANDRMYFVDDDCTTLHPMPNWFGDKMDNLVSWTDCTFQINSAIDYI